MSKGLVFRVNQRPIGEVKTAKVKITCPFDGHGNQRGLTEPIDFDLEIDAYPADAELLKNHGMTGGVRRVIKEMDFGIADNLGAETHHFDLKDCVVVDWKLKSSSGAASVPVDVDGDGIVDADGDLVVVKVKSANVALHADGKTIEFRRGVQPGR